MFAENPAVFLRDFGVPCAANGVSFTGLFDEPDDTLSMGGVNVQSTMYTLTLKSSDVTAATVASGGPITVNGAAFVVRDVMLIDDGIFSKLTLSK